MSNVDMHQVNFEWPYTNPKTVTVTGTFDQWKSTCHLTRTPGGFAGSIKIPWNQTILYKFIVDGHWVLRYDQPTETEGRTGYVNHVYTAPPKPVFSLESSESLVITDAGKHKGHTKVGVNGHSGAISNGITAEAPERRVQLIAVPSSDKFDRPSSGGSETVPNMSAPPTTDSDAAAFPPHPVEESQKESSLAPIVPIMIVPVNAQENNSSIPSSSPPAVIAPPETDVVSEASEDPAKDVAVKADQLSTHSPIAAVSEVKSDPAVQEKSDPKPAEVSEPVADKVDEPKAVTAVEDKHAETSNKEEPASAPADGVVATAPSPEKTKKCAPPPPPNKAHVFPTSGSPPSSPSSSRFNSAKGRVKKRTLTILGRIKKAFKSDKEKANEETK